MAYQANIPQPTDAIKDSQSDILANFQAIQTLINVNHGTFDAATEGKHLWVSLPVQGASPATALAEVALYSRTSAYTGNPELSYRKQSNGAVVECTSASLVSGTGWTFLPSGLLMKWGSVTVLGAGTQTITFPVGAAIPAFSSAFSAQVTPFTTNTAQVVTIVGYYFDHLDVQAALAGTQVLYLVIGVA